MNVTDERLTAMGLLAETWSALVARSAAQLAEHGLSVVEFEVLIRLARSPHRVLRMTDLSAQTALSTSGVTRVVDRLVERDLVTRRPCATDRRTTYAVLSEGGSDLLDRALPGHLALIDTWLTGPLAETGELDAFIAGLRRLRDRVAPCATVGTGRSRPAGTDPEIPSVSPAGARAGR